jgi:hypothetical protein
VRQKLFLADLRVKIAKNVRLTHIIKSICRYSAGFLMKYKRVANTKDVISFFCFLIIILYISGTAGNIHDETKTNINRHGYMRCFICAAAPDVEELRFTDRYAGTKKAWQMAEPEVRIIYALGNLQPVGHC